MSADIKPNAAKKLVTEYLEEQGISYLRVAARTVSFEGLGYGRKLFVTVYGWTPDPRADDLKAIGKANGFVVDFSLEDATKT